MQIYFFLQNYISKNDVKKCLKNQNIASQKRKMTLKEIYNEFWEFIDEYNEKFRDLINSNLRRNQTSLIYYI